MKADSLHVLSEIIDKWRATLVSVLKQEAAMIFLEQDFFYIICMLVEK